MSNFDPHNSNHLSSSSHSAQPGRSLETIQRDRFELLSAYMDGEVTADERRQVEEWLANDSTVQRLHTRLLKLRQSFQAMPVPTSDQQSVQQTVDAVLARVDRRSRFSVIWGGVAIAAVAVGVVTSALMGERSPLPQFALRPNTPEVQAPSAADPDLMLVALDKPLVSIPKTPVASPNDPAASQIPNNSTIR